MFRVKAHVVATLSEIAATLNCHKIRGKVCRTTVDFDEFQRITLDTAQCIVRCARACYRCCWQTDGIEVGCLAADLYIAFASAWSSERAAVVEVVDGATWQRISTTRTFVQGDVVAVFIERNGATGVVDGCPADGQRAVIVTDVVVAAGVAAGRDGICAGIAAARIAAAETEATAEIALRLVADEAAVAGSIVWGRVAVTDVLVIGRNAQVLFADVGTGRGLVASTGEDVVILVVAGQGDAAPLMTALVPLSVAVVVPS